MKSTTAVRKCSN